MIVFFNFHGHVKMMHFHFVLVAVCQFFWKLVEIVDILPSNGWARIPNKITWKNTRQQLNSSIRRKLMPTWNKLVFEWDHLIEPFDNRSSQIQPRLMNRSFLEDGCKLKMQFTPYLLFFTSRTESKHIHNFRYFFFRDIQLVRWATKYKNKPWSMRTTCLSLLPPEPSSDIENVLSKVAGSGISS